MSLQTEVIIRWFATLTESFRYPSILVQVAEEQTVDECGLPEA
jgi:hypothetical protein